MCGAVGVLIHSKVSGMLFDGWMYQAPFVYMGVFNALICVWAIAVRLRYGRSTTSGAEASAPEVAGADRGQVIR